MKLTKHYGVEVKVNTGFSWTVKRFGFATEKQKKDFMKWAVKQPYTEVKDSTTVPGTIEMAMTFVKAEIERNPERIRAKKEETYLQLWVIVGDDYKELNDKCPPTWSKALIREWADQRLGHGITEVKVIDPISNRVIYSAKEKVRA